MTSMLLILGLAASVLRADVRANVAWMRNNSDNQIIPPGLTDFQGVDVNQALEVYAQLTGKTLLRSGLPSGQIVLEIDTPLTKAEAIDVLQAVLALHGIAVIDVPGGKFIKVVPTAQACQTGEPFNEQNPGQLSELGSCLDRVVRSNYLKPSQVLSIIQPLSKSPDAVVPLDASGILVLHDNAKNVKRMMEMIELANFLYQAGDGPATTRMWQRLSARIELVASYQKAPAKSSKNATASTQ